jgi:hypothetical protein
VKLFQREQATGETVRTAPASGLQLPEPPHPVKLVFPGGRNMPARVTQRDGDELVVLMLYPLPRPIRDAERNSIVIEVIDDGHISRLGGRASLVDHETLRFADLHFVQRREYVRIKATVPVFVTPSGERYQIQCASLDLSGGGMLLRGLDMLAIGDHIEFSFAIGEDNTEITGTAAIVRCDEQGNSALCFEQISEADRRRLIRFLFERQREERRKGLRLDC